MTAFDKACMTWSASMVANGKHWKDYFGAAYSTRMRAAIANVRATCDDMEKCLNEDEK